MSAFIARLTLDIGRRGRRDHGQDLLEYALLVALIVLVAAGAVGTVGTTVTTVFWDAIAAVI